METFAEYLLNEKDLVSKMDILYRLQKMLRERKNISIYFNNAVNSKNVFRIHGRGKRSRWKLSANSMPSMQLQKNRWTTKFRKFI